jgi:Domain of Unknown Function (DUF1080)
MNKLLPLFYLASVVVTPGLAQNAGSPVTPKHALTEIEVDGIKGFQDTPMEPDGRWHVHDPARPQPTIVTPGTNFSSEAAPPSDAIVLFDGNGLSQWTDGHGHPAPWIIKDGTAITTQTDIFTKQEFGDIQLHLEFREPVPPAGSGQDRGNSGIFFMGRYEIQVLDCFNNKTYPDGATGAIYAQHPPLVNACRPPGEWQTYDIVFTAPQRGTLGEVITPAYATVILNGVVVQNHQAVRGTTTHCAVGEYAPQGPAGPLGLQYHLNTVAFRNIWVRPVPLVNEP